MPNQRGRFLIAEVLDHSRKLMLEVQTLTIIPDDFGYGYNNGDGDGYGFGYSYGSGYGYG